MPAHWTIRDAVSLTRAVRLRWRTRHGFKISDSPAFDGETDAWFRQRLETAVGYVEFGSGASTILAARLGIPTFSMESDPRYAQAVRESLPQSARSTILDAAIGLTEFWGFPVHTRRSPARLKTWLNYALQPLAEATRKGWTPDFVLVDGRFRCACTLAAARSMACANVSGDILFDDYAGRDHYNWIESYLGSPRMIGRAALFRVDASSKALAETLSDALIAQAVGDFR